MLLLLQKMRFSQFFILFTLVLAFLVSFSLYVSLVLKNARNFCALTDDQALILSLKNKINVCEGAFIAFTEEIVARNNSCDNYSSLIDDHTSTMYDYDSILLNADSSADGDESLATYSGKIDCIGADTSPAYLDQVTCNYKQYRSECHRMLEETKAAFESQNGLNDSKSYCEGEFDDLICWPHTKRDEIGYGPCPNYMKKNSTVANLTNLRYCGADGEWMMREIGNTGESEVWRYLGECNPFNFADAPVEEVESGPSEALLEQLTVAYKVGYGISITFILAALAIFTFFKKLRCVRNYIHMNLMISFLFRYVTMIIHDKVVRDYYNATKDRILDNDTCEEFLNNEVFVSCRLVTTFWHYTVMSNYFWLFVEGIHLFILVTRPLKSTKNKKYFPFYMIVGWGVPLILMVIWAVLRLTLENTKCWNLNDKQKLWLIIDIPIILTIVMNFVIFIYIICVILSKLQSNSGKNKDYKYSLAWSTLTLMPLLGIHYVVFLVVNAGIFDDESAATKTKGFLVALFYCFLNTEVKGEVRKRWNKWQTLRKLSVSAPRRFSGQHNVNYTQATSLVSTTHPEERLWSGADTLVDAQV